MTARDWDNHCSLTLQSAAVKIRQKLNLKSNAKIRKNQMQKSNSEQGYFPPVGNNIRFYFQQEGKILEGFHLTQWAT